MELLEIISLNWPAALCLIAGFVLVTVEMFHPRAFGVPGISGLALLLIGVIVAADSLLEGILLTIIIVLVLCLMFLCSRTIPARRKVTAAACVIFLFASIVVIPLEYIWCGFRQPNGFYSRIAIFAWFFLLIIAAERVAAGWHGKARIAPVIPWAICLITCFELSYSAITIWKQLYVGYEESFHERYVTEADAQLAYLTEYDTGAWRFERTYQRAWPASLNEGAAVRIQTAFEFTRPAN